jgi:ABC-type sulfate/molybdate transport systems ATPase subunit
MLGLDKLLDRLPKALSGGQRQRVAMGRAIVRRPSLFLFDEPLSNLDAALRAQVRVDIRKLHDELGATSVYVTHDQVEAMTLADVIFVLNKGVVEQAGAPARGLRAAGDALRRELPRQPRDELRRRELSEAKPPGWLAKGADGCAVPVDAEALRGRARAGRR